MHKLFKKIIDYIYKRTLEPYLLSLETRIGGLESKLNDVESKLNDKLDDVEGKVISTLRLSILNNETALRNEKIPQPCSADTFRIVNDYSVGYSCNLLNNSYIFCKIARKNGCRAMLFLEPNFTDTAVTSQPCWEEVFFHGDEMPKSCDELPYWNPPDFVISAKWNLNYLNGVSLSFDYTKMKELFDGTPVEIKDPISYLMAYTVLPHRDILKLYDSVDILHVSGTHIGLASFTNKPYITFPFGGDLFFTPFEDSEIGCMQVRGFRKATRHILGGKIFLDYMDSLGISRKKIDLIPFMVDTDVYAPLPENPLRNELRERFPGKIIFFIGARQNWIWKGSDKLWNAVAKVKGRTDKAVFLTVWYGQDTGKSDALLKSKEIEDVICKIGILSKGLMRKYIDAVDVCIDQFTHGGLGTFSLESMSCGKPLITYYNREKHFDFEKDPPVMNSFTEDEIFQHIMYCLEYPGALTQHGDEDREWIKRYHGHEVLWPEYDAAYRKALMDKKSRD